MVLPYSPTIWRLGMALLCLGCGAKTGLLVDDADRGDSDADAAPPVDLCVELPADEPSGSIDLSFVARLASVEVTLLVDVTGSMEGEIGRIRAALRDVIVPGMADALPELRLSVAYFADFPEHPYGGRFDVPFGLALSSSADIAAVQAALDGLPAMAGGDEPESQVEALFQLATGSGRDRFVAPASCPPGTTGYVCYGPTAARVALLFTDAPFHGGVSSWADPYNPRYIDPLPATFEEMLGAVRAAGIKVLGFWSDALGREPEDLDAVARATGAVTTSGEPIVREIGSAGEGLDESVIDAVRTFADETPLDVDVLLEDVPGDDRDAREFVTRISALFAVPSDGATVGPDRFDDVRPGTRVWFRLDLRNDLEPPAEEDRRFALRVVLRGNGFSRLAETVVEIVIPGPEGVGCPPD